jgi:hypothetical protein
MNQLQLMNPSKHERNYSSVTQQKCVFCLQSACITTNSITWLVVAIESTVSSEVRTVFLNIISKKLVDGSSQVPPLVDEEDPFQNI